MADNAAATPASPQKPSPASPSAPTTGHTSPSIPVALNEAALDSPSFRATAVHFGDQVEGVERWLEGYVRSTSKLVHDFLALEETINSFAHKAVPASIVADGVIDNDYTLLALKRAGDGSREWLSSILATMRKMETISVEPIRFFLTGELRNFKEIRKTLEQTQKTFDSTQARYLGQAKTKEPSSLREDAFAVYETRKTYLRAALDYCQLAPQLRYSLDRLLVRVCADIWKEVKRPRDTGNASAKWGEEMERLRGWTKEMESSEGILKRELYMARREVGENTLATFKPSRELDDYSASTVPFLGSRGPMSLKVDGKGAVVSEKQGWLFLRTLSGKPVRYVWTRRWYYCRDGIFGWLVHGPQGVLQGDEIGVLLCNAKPAVQEERRFCFEVKTKNQNLLLQAETQAQLMEWLEVFEVAKKQTFEATMGRDNSSLPGGIDPAFSITPSIPEFSAKNLDNQLEDIGSTLDRVGPLPVAGADGGLAPHGSFDVTGNAPRRSITALGRELQREEGESGRDHASRLMQKLDMHRKAAFGQESGQASGPQSSGGIASLISASHNLLPGYTGYSPSMSTLSTPKPPPSAMFLPSGETQASSLAPATLAQAPTWTSLSRSAIVASGEQGASATRGMPMAIMANYWGSSSWGTIFTSQNDSVSAMAESDDPFMQAMTQITSPASRGSGDATISPLSGIHRKTISMDTKLTEPRTEPKMTVDRPAAETFPLGYPAELRCHHAQFRLLFPTAPPDERLVLVFNAAWTSTSQNGSNNTGFIGNGRIYVTPDIMYFYGHAMGLVTAYTISLDMINEVTSAPGRDCDFIYLHLGQDVNRTDLARIIIKTFLDDLHLLHARLNLLIDDLQAEEPMELSEIVQVLINLENDEDEKKIPSAESWEEVSSDTPIDDGAAGGSHMSRRTKDLTGRHRSNVRTLGRHVPKLQLPTHPVVYEPEDMQKRITERHFEISAKACFHVLFGDRSFIFPRLYFEHRAKEIAQGPWELADHGKMKRQFKFKVDNVDMLGRAKSANVADYQIIDVFSDHVTYVVTHVKTPWHLPHSSSFRLVSKVVITHIAKSECKLAIYTRVDWSKTPAFSKSLVQHQAETDVARDAERLAEVATDQIRRLGPHSRTKRAIQVYGNIGQQQQIVIFTPGESEPASKAQVKPRTLTAMLFETVSSLGESVASSLMMWAFAAVKKVFTIVTAHRFILLLLFASATANLFLFGRESSTWWSERRAAKFMNRIGVGPNVMMSKAIYLTDLEEASRGTGLGIPAAPQDSACYDTFRAILNTTDLDSPYMDVGASLSSASGRAAARRLRRTRQRLGSYRHDLVVAMRVVNSIEREMVQSEWENWLADENARCEQVHSLLMEGERARDRNDKERKKDGGMYDEEAQKTMRLVEGKKLDSLRSWYEDYCGSCHVDQAALVEERNQPALL